jgi:hypothetical protein
MKRSLRLNSLPPFLFRLLELEEELLDVLALDCEHAPTLQSQYCKLRCWLVLLLQVDDGNLRDGLFK